MIIDRYGLIAMGALWSLEEAGIISIKPTCLSWDKIKSKFKLLELHFKTKDKPVDPYEGVQIPYQGYVPLIVRFVEKIIMNQSKDLKNDLEKLKIPFKQKNDTNNPKRFLVAFVGGMMFGEASCLRILSQQLNIHIDMITTEELTNETVLDQFIHT